MHTTHKRRAKKKRMAPSKQRTKQRRDEEERNRNDRRTHKEKDGQQLSGYEEMDTHTHTHTRIDQQITRQEKSDNEGALFFGREAERRCEEAVDVVGPRGLDHGRGRGDEEDGRMREKRGRKNHQSQSNRKSGVCRRKQDIKESNGRSFTPRESKADKREQRRATHTHAHTHKLARQGKQRGLGTCGTQGTDTQKEKKARRGQ